MNKKMGMALGVIGLLGAYAKAETNEAFFVSGYVSTDVASGYVMYGARADDEPCLQTYVDLSLGASPWGAIRAMLWQNTDLTSRRRESFGRINEWDWYLYYQNKFPLTQDWRLEINLGHIWYKFHNLTSLAKPLYQTMEEWSVRFALENPYVTPYFAYQYDHQVTHGQFMFGGLRHTFQLTEALSVTADLSIGGGDRNYLECLYPPFDGSVAGGLTYAGFQVTATYWFTANFGVHASIAHFSLLDPDIRDAVSAYDHMYANDYLWGSVGLDFAF